MLFGPLPVLAYDALQRTKETAAKVSHVDFRKRRIYQVREAEAKRCLCLLYSETGRTLSAQTASESEAQNTVPLPYDGAPHMYCFAGRFCRTFYGTIGMDLPSTLLIT